MIKSCIREDTTDGLYSINAEVFDSYTEMIRSLDSRNITNPKFHNVKKESLSPWWHGVRTYEQALDLLADGYSPAVSKLYDEINVKNGRKISGTNRGFKTMTAVVGYQPVVPLAINGIPSNMLCRQIEKVESRVINLFIDVTCSQSMLVADLILCGVMLMRMINNLELCGHKINLYICEAFAGEASADLVCIKTKNSDSPLDLRRISFPLCHTAFTRVICFDWYSKFPLGIFRKRYGTTLTAAVGPETASFLIKKIFGPNSIYISNMDIRSNGESYLKQALQIEGVQNRLP